MQNATRDELVVSGAPCQLLSVKLATLIREGIYMFPFIYMQIYLHTFANTISHLQIQPLFAGVEAINHLLVLQFTRTDHQPCQTATEKLSHAQFTTFKTRGRKKSLLVMILFSFSFVKQQVCQLIHTVLHTCRLVFIHSGC